MGAETAGRDTSGVWPLLLPSQALEPSPPGSLPRLQSSWSHLCSEPLVRIICLKWSLASLPLRPDPGLLWASVLTMGASR